MQPYQEEYLELLRSVALSARPAAENMEPEAFVTAVLDANRASRKAVAQGSRLLRENLFPVLDNILASSEAEIASILEFAGELMRGTAQKDIGLHYQIHLALMNRARHRGDRDMLIRELYQVGMSLYNMETMLSPSEIKLYTARMRMCFAESASYFETHYDEIQNPEIRGYIHRSMGNIALSYDTRDSASAGAKLAAVSRSIAILSDPEIRAKTPSLPWDVYLYKSHQERTTLLSYLRSGSADPDAFAKVLESAQFVQRHQRNAARKRGESLDPRWQYAYLAARYHCGAVLLPELLDALYGLSTACDSGDMSVMSMTSHVSIPALYMEYAKQLKDGYTSQQALQANRMTRRLFGWIVRAPSNDDNEQLMFYLRQFLYVYKEEPCGFSFFDALQNIFATRHPTTYVRMWIAGQIAETLTLWAAEDCPDRLVGVPGYPTVKDVIWNRKSLAALACQGGRLYDTGMVHFLNLENSACRGLFAEEEALIRLHTHCGAELLSRHASTAMFADVARGHHRHYDEKGGYPTDFSPSASPVRPLIYITAVADALASSVEETSSRYRPAVSFEQVCAQLRAGSGTQYAPYIVALLKPEARLQQLRDRLTQWQKEAYLDMYHRREQMQQL